jgi:hypothetical protein
METILTPLLKDGDDHSYFVPTFEVSDQEFR